MKLSAALVLTVWLLCASAAGAAIPSGNLLTNPGAEDGPAAHDSSQVFVPPGWTFSQPEFRMTAVYYGSLGFPTAEQGVALGGGHAFFAGGPPQPEGQPDQRSAIAVQEIPLPPDAFADVDAGAVQATGGGCFGGYADQEDTVVFGADFLNSGGQALTGTNIAAYGPDAKARGKQTKLLPVSATRPVPAGARFVRVVLQLIRVGDRAYNDAYADNILMQLTPAGSTPPEPTCSAAASTPPPPGPPPGNQPLTPNAISRGSSKARYRSGRIAVTLACAGQGAACSGTLRLTVPSLSAHSSSVTLGSRSFSIAAGKSATVAVRVGRRAKARLNRLSARQVRRLKVRASVKMGTASAKFTLRLLSG
jgi:hypothetical protein